jgi:hypothetical protein
MARGRKRNETEKPKAADKVEPKKETAKAEPPPETKPVVKPEPKPEPKQPLAAPEGFPKLNLGCNLCENVRKKGTSILCGDKEFWTYDPIKGYVQDKVHCHKRNANGDCPGFKLRGTVKC